MPRGAVWQGSAPPSQNIQRQQWGITKYKIHLLDANKTQNVINQTELTEDSTSQRTMSTFLETRANEKTHSLT